MYNYNLFPPHPTPLSSFHSETLRFPHGRGNCIISALRFTLYAIRCPLYASRPFEILRPSGPQNDIPRHPKRSGDSQTTGFPLHALRFTSFLDSHSSTVIFGLSRKIFQGNFALGEKLVRINWGVWNDKEIISL